MECNNFDRFSIIISAQKVENVVWLDTTNKYSFSFAI